MVKKVHCLFEQSGTFKEEFKKLGVDAEDYDILNQFNETDNVVDLFHEIEVAYEGGAIDIRWHQRRGSRNGFLPMHRIRSPENHVLPRRCIPTKKYSDERKLEDCLYYHKALHRNYELITKLAIVALRKNIAMVIENPYSSQHYLTNYWCLKPKVIDLDRTKHGDAYQKPTQYWFLNCEPKNNIIMDGIQLKKKKQIEKGKTVERSMIEHDYARWFIKEFVLDEEQIDRGY